MGIFLKALQRQHEVHYQDFFVLNSLTKIKEYYSLFKNISETYSIDNQQFTELFGKHEEIFKILDTDNNLLIDGLQLFSGLILLSKNIKYSDKVVLLFELFDFNNLKSLARNDIQFLFISCCSVITKVYGLKNWQDDNFIEEFVREEFPSNERVNISQMLKWSKNSDIVGSFFRIIDHQYQKQIKKRLTDKIYIKLEKNKANLDMSCSHHYSKQQQLIAQTQKMFRFPEQPPQLDLTNCDINPLPQWIYGIRYKDVKQFIEYVINKGQELIIYFVGKVAIIYNLLSHKQRHYMGHKHQIISIAVNGIYCATGQYAKSPQIRVWNNKTLETIQIIKGCHVQGVHLIKFLNNNLLITCGCRQESPILIFDIESATLILSTYCNSPAIQIATLSNFTNRQCEQFIIGSLYGIYRFQVITDSSQKMAINFSKLIDGQIGTSRLSKITTCCYFMINCTFKHLRQYDEKVEKFIITGHENGTINVWSMLRGEIQYNFSQEAHQIIKLIPTPNYLVVITNSSFISYYDIDIEEKEKIKIIDITQTQKEMQSYDLCECLICPKSHNLLIFTQKADMFFLSQQELQQTPMLTHFTHKRYNSKAIDHILPIQGSIQMQKLVTKQKQQILYIAVDHLIKGIDLNTHLYVREWNIGQKIVSFDAIHTKSHGLFLIAATVQNRLYTFCNLTQNVNKIQVDSDIISIIAHSQESPSIIVILVSTTQSIIKYNFIKSTFSNPYPINKPNFSPQMRPFESTKLLLSGQDNQLYALIIKELHVQNLFSTNYKTTAPLVKIYYHISQDNQKIYLPAIVGCQTKALVAGREDGKLHCWNNYEQLSNKNFITLDAHISKIADITFSQNQKQLISSGKDDSMIIQWRFKYYNQQKTANTANKIREETFQAFSDEFSNRRVQFCKFENNILGKTYDQHLSIKGINSEIIRRLFKTNLNQWKINNKLMRFQEPSINLKLDFAFGIETFNKNNTIIALPNPKRYLYFISKLLVIYDQANNSQVFYRGHRFRITSFVLLEDNIRVASAQTAYRPSIHIWSTKTLQTLRIIHTTHRWGIIQLVTKGNILLSYGFKQIKYQDESSNQNEQIIMEKNIYSYQVTDYQKGYLIAQREQKDLIHDLAIDPSNHCQFATCNDGSVTFWQIKFNTIIKKKTCYLGGDTPTCCLYYQPGKGEPDLFVGTSSGSIGLVSRKKYWTVFKKSQKQSKRINCMLIVKREMETLFIIASENNQLKIYNEHFEEKLSESMLKIEPIQQASKKVRESKGEKQDRNCSIQSLTIVPYDKSSKDLKGDLRILIGTRNGEVLELVEVKREGYSSKGMSFKSFLFLRFNTSQCQKRVGNKVFVAHHPKMEIVATIGRDQQVIFWDTQQKKLMSCTELNFEKDKCYPTAIKFSNTGDHLIIGFSDGLLIFLQSKMSKAMQSKTDEKYCPPNLGKMKRQKDQDGQSVLNIELSENGQYIAVSYQKITPSKSQSHIKISHFKLKEKIKSNKNQFEKILDNTSILPSPHTSKTFHSQSGLIYGFGSYSLAFAMAENSSKHYFLSYYQMIDQNQNRLAINLERQEERNYKIWEVSDSIYPVNSPLIESIRWKKFYIHNSIQTNYIFHETPLALNPKLQKPPSNNNLDLSQFSNMALLENYFVTSSFNGDLHVFRLATLEGDGQGMVGKTFPGHSCKINQIQTFNTQKKHIIYTSGQNDECILKWIVQQYQSLIVSEDYKQEQKDSLFLDLPTSQELKIKLELYKTKSNIGRVTVRDQSFINWFSIGNIIGRKAEHIKNNLKYDKQGKIIYSSGHSIIITEPHTNSKQFIYIKSDPTYSLQEITALQLTLDGQLLIACHSGIISGIMIWQLSSKLLLKQLYLKSIVYIVNVAISSDNMRLVVYGITAASIGQIVLIDIDNQEVMAVATYTHKQPWHIKALCFVPNNHDKFMTCGVEHIKEWSYMSSQIIYQSSYSLETQAINTCISFIEDKLVTVTDHGQLIIWEGSSSYIKRKQHQDMINCLTITQCKSYEKFIIATGSIYESQNHPQVVLWVYTQKEKEKSLTAIQKINIKDQNLFTVITSSKIDFAVTQQYTDIQSLFMREEINHKLLIGLSKGDIYQYSYDWILKKQANNQKAIQLFSFEDQQCVKAMVFINEEQLLQISENGFLRAWKLPKITLLWSHNFNSPVINMVYSDIYQLIIIAFKECIRFFNYSSYEGKLTIVEIEDKYRQFRFITHLILSHNQKSIALATELISDKKKTIQLFETKSKTFKYQLKFHVDETISFIDFNRITNDKAFMLVKSNQRIELFDLNLATKLNSQLITKIDWNGQGLVYSQKTDIIKRDHEERFNQGTIKHIIELQSSYIILNSYSGIYWYYHDTLVASCDLNMSSIDCFALSKSNKWLAVGSRIDRNATQGPNDLFITVIDANRYQLSQQHVQYINKMNIKYLNLPIYSIAIYGQYIYFAGGGGGSTGIPNQIKIYHRTITPQPATSILTGNKIIENLTVFQDKQLVVCNANDHIVVYEALQSGKNLQEKYRFKADFKMKDPTINSICFSQNGEIISTGGDDLTVRFYKLGQKKADLVHQYLTHSYPIKNVDHNQQDLYLSTDNHHIAICNLSKKQLVRTIYQDQLLPEKSLFQSAFFAGKGSQELIITHFIFKKATYVTKERKGKLQTIEVAEDQSCQTAFHRENQLLGIACGNGTTLMWDTNKMKSLGREQNHKFVITGCTITPKTNRFLTGTPQCSYNIQNASEQFNFSWRIPLNIIFCLLVIYLLGSNNLITDEL